MRTMRLLAVAIGIAAVSTACKDSDPNKNVGPVNEAPNAKFSFECAARRCDFRDASTDDAAVASWSWAFGDNASSGETSPNHTYGSAGPYNVSLTVTDAEGETSTQTKQVVATDPAVTTLSCVDGSAPGGFVACTLTLEQEASFNVVLNSSSCTAHGNVFRVTAPRAGTLTTDGCYESAGKTLTFAGAFAAGTQINAEVVAPVLANAPRLKVTGSYPQWSLTFEDGEDADFNDLVMTLTATPTGN